MNNSNVRSHSPDHSRRLISRVTSTLLCASLLAQPLACADGGGSIDPKERVVTTELVSLTPSEGGVQQSTSLLSDDFVLGDYTWSNRELIVDGVRTAEPDAIYSARIVEVPLRAGGVLRLEREGDVFRLQQVAGDSSHPAGDVALRLSDEGITILSPQREEGLLIRISGLEDLPETNRALIAALAVDILTTAAEQRDTVDPITVALVVAAVGGVLGLVPVGAWAVVCGLTVGNCIASFDEWEAACGGVDLSYDGKALQVKLGGGFFCRER